MSFESGILFWQNVQADQGLQEELRPIDDQPEEGQAAVIARIAQAAGFSVTAEELVQVESVLQFWKGVQQDSKLQADLESAQQSDSEEETLAAVAQVAQGAGYSFPVEALSAVTSALAAPGSSGERELSDAELSRVAGGLRASIGTAIGGGLAHKVRNPIGTSWTAVLIYWG